MRMTGNVLAGSWERWADRVEELQSERAEDKRKHDVMKRIVSNMMSQVMARAFEWWHVHCKHVIVKRTLWKRIVMRMTRNLLSGSLNVWAHNVMQLQSEHLAMQRILKGMLDAMISTAIHRWRQNVHTKKMMASEALEVIVSQLIQCVASTMDAWHKYAAEQIFNRALVRRIVFRLTHRCTLMIVERWYKNAMELRVQGALMQRFMARIYQRGVYALFERWAESVEKLKAMCTKARKTMARWTHQSLSTCLGVWLECTNVETMKRARECRILFKITIKYVALSFARLVQNWHAVKAQRTLMHRAVALMKLRGLFTWFEAWREHWHKQYGLCNKNRRCTDKIVQKILYQCLWFWYDFSQAEKLRKDFTVPKLFTTSTTCILRCLNNMEKRQVVKNCFRSWCELIVVNRTAAYVGHVISCLLARFSRTRRLNLLSAVMTTFTDRMDSAKEKNYHNNLIFLQLNRSARTMKLSNFSAWSSILDLDDLNTSQGSDEAASTEVPSSTATYGGILWGWPSY